MAATEWLRELRGHVRWLLGERRRWVVALPTLSLLGTAAELAMIVAIVRSLLLLANDENRAHLSTPFGDWTPTLATLLWLAAAACIAATVVRVVDSIVVGRLAARASTSARRHVIDAWFASDWRRGTTERTGRLQQLLGVNAQHAIEAVPMLGTAMTSVIGLTVYGIGVAVVSPIAGGLFIALGLVALGGLAGLRRSMKATAVRTSENLRDLQLSATTLNAARRELQQFGVEPAAAAQLAEANRRAQPLLGRMRSMQRLLPNLFQQVVLLLIIITVAAAAALDLDAARFGTAVAMSLRSVGYLSQLSSTHQNFVEAAPYLQELRDVTAQHELHRRRREDKPLTTIESIDLQGASFSYGGQPTLRDIDLRVTAGERIGIVGPSGGGKSTLAGLLVGLHDLDGGQYLVNGEPSTAYSSETWAREVALLSQEPTLLRGTVAENISFFRDGDRSEVTEAAEQAVIADEIARLPEGFDTQIGEGHGDLSGGQRQRVALARALLLQPSMLILDEPTSALDATNAELLEAAVDALDHVAVTIVISHRRALLERCDRYVIIEAGRIVADGAAGELDIARYVGRLASPEAPAAGP